MATTLLELEMELLARASLSLLAEELVEHVFMAEMLVTAWVLTLCLSLNTLFSVLIVDPALLGVRECLVGVGDFLELLLGLLGVVLVFVWVEPNGHLLEGLLDLILIGTTVQSQYLVIVLLGRDQAEEETEC